MSKPDPMVQENQDAGSEEDWVCEFHHGEAAEVEGVDDVGGDAEEGREEGETVDC